MVSEPADTEPTALRMGGEGGADVQQSPVAILAGGGGVPIEIADHLVQTGVPFHIVGIRGFASAAIERHPHTWCGLGAVGGMLRAMQDHHCRRLIIIGSLERPDLTKLRFDFGAIRHARAILSLTSGGDDTMLRRIVRFFESQGLEVVGVSDLAPGLVVGEGRIAGPPRTAPQQTAIDLGCRALIDLSQLDVGQAVVASAEGLIAVEDGGGTRRMLERFRAVASRPDEAVLVKLAKPEQELRVDMPTVGPNTVEEMVGAGISCLIVGAETTVVADRARFTEKAEAAGLSVFARPYPDRSPQQDADGLASGHNGRLRDASIAQAIVEIMSPHVGDATTDCGAAVREGHAQAVEIDALKRGTWPQRIARLPKGWGLSRVFMRRRNGVMALAMLGGEATWPSVDHLLEVARAADQQKFVAIHVFVDPRDRGDTSGWSAWARDVLAAKKSARLQVALTLHNGAEVMSKGDVP
ncbi:MAG: UDP-2,3-diacylglucosamine diphosphatase LpxI [Pseudomonadota bacterium]